MITENEILEKFPKESPRDGQLNAISKILNSDKKFFILEGPTGSGKSVIGYTVAQFFNDAYWLCPQKILQDQITDEFNDNVRTIDLKGRNSYPCTYWDTLNKLKAAGSRAVVDMPTPKKPHGYVGCDEGVCKKSLKQSKCDICTNPDHGIGISCAYYKRLQETINSHLAIMNFKSFLFQTMTQSFAERDLIIVDEAHDVEGVLLDFVSINLNESHFNNINFPELKTFGEYIDWIKSSDIVNKIKQLEMEAGLHDDVKGEEKWKSLRRKVEYLIKSAKPDEWVFKFDVSNIGIKTIEFKPIYVKDIAHNKIFDLANKKVLLMSATILSKSVICNSLGINPKEVDTLRMRNRFPVENRPIRIIRAGSMSFRNKAKTFPAMIDLVNDICNIHEGERGIIHTHNFEIAYKLIGECENKIRRRFTFQKDYNDKKDMLKDHATKPGSIIVAPAMHEGLDLKDDLGRFQIICKVPYPSLVGNPQLKARADISFKYYNWLVAIKLIQSYGRVVRSPTDHGETYIVDSDIDAYINRASALLPKWFTEAIVSD